MIFPFFEILKSYFDKLKKVFDKFILQKFILKLFLNSIYKKNKLTPMYIFFAK